MADAKKVVSAYQFLKKEKHTWNIHFQVLSEYFLTRKADFTVNFQPGTFLNRDLFDSTGPKCAKIMASALLGLLWPEGSVNFQYKRSKNIDDTEEHKKYFDEISHRLHCALNYSECGLSLALNEYMLEAVTFGTSGVGVFEPNGASEDQVFLFQAWDIKRMVIDEGPNGIVNRIYYEYETTLRNAVIDFGEKALSDKSRDLYNKGSKDTKINILHAVEPREERNPDGMSVYDMPVASTYVELGEDKILKESGYPEMTVFVNRFFKNIREKYGRSSAMDALPDVLELNAIREAEIVATEKSLDPPLGILDDGRLGSGTVDTSAGAINVFNITGRVGNQPPVFPLFTIGDLKYVKERIEELKQSVSDHFMIDRLLDLNNETEMTLGEVQIRNKLRATMLSSVFSRQIKEVFDPLMDRCFHMMLEKGKFGTFKGSEDHRKAMLFGDDVLLIPDDIAKAIFNGDDFYELEYLTPAMRMMQAEAAEGIINLWKFMNDVAQTQPEVYDNVDEDLSAKLIAKFFGAPREVIRSKQFIKDIRDARNQQMAERQKHQDALEEMKAMGHLKGLAPQQPAPGVENAILGAPLQA